MLGHFCHDTTGDSGFSPCDIEKHKATWGTVECKDAAIPADAEAAVPAEASGINALDPASGWSNELLLDQDHALNPLRYLKGTPRIVFAIATCQALVGTRAAVQLQTWCSDIGACVWFSDQTNEAAGPATKMVLLDAFGLDLNEIAQREPYQEAQLRFLPIIYLMKQLIESNANGHFSQLDWLVLADEDSYIFPFNLREALHPLDPHKPLYTGNVSPERWFPLRFDEYGNDLGVETNTPFVNGGAGSYLSRAAVSAMDMASCIESSLPNHEWWKMQSDWMIGLCTERAGFGPTTLNEGIFNSFA